MGRFRAAAQVAAFFLIGMGGSPLAYGGDGAVVPVDSLHAVDGRQQIGSLNVTAAVDSATALILKALRGLGSFARRPGAPPGEVDVLEVSALDPDRPFTLAEVSAAYDTGYDYDGAQTGAKMPALKREYSWHLTYRSNVPDGLTPRPDLQLDRYPGMNITLDDSSVVGLRWELDYGWAR
jgi:hypothetical protein